MVMMNYSSECMTGMQEWVNKQNTILEKQIIKAKAKEMQQELDREVLWSMLGEDGLASCYASGLEPQQTGGGCCGMGQRKLRAGL